MSRITKKYYCGYDIENREYDTKYTEEEIFNVIQELGKLEDLEEQLGCPLDVLIKLLIQEKCFDKNGNEIDASFINFKTLNIVVECYDYNGDDIKLSYLYIPLSDYKKTWWLKEDKSK